MSNENLNRSEIKLAENMVFGKLTLRSVFRNTKDGVIWSCGCASCNQTVQMTEANLLSGIYDRCMACTVRKKSYKNGKAQWERLCRNVQAGHATMDESWTKYADMVEDIGVPTAYSKLQVIENGDGSNPHYGPDTCYWDDAIGGKPKPKPLVVEKEPRTRGTPAFTRGRKYFSEVKRYSRQRHFSWMLNQRHWNGVIEAAPEWASDYALYLKAVNVPLSRRYNLNRIDPTKPMRDGNWYWCLKRRATYSKNLMDVVGECGLPMVISPQTHPDLFLYENIEPYITSNTVAGKTTFTLIPPPDMKERVSKMVDQFGLRSLSWDAKLCEEVSQWLELPKMNEVIHESVSQVVVEEPIVAATTAVPGLLTLAYGRDALRKINQRAYNWLYRGLMEPNEADTFDVIDLLGQPFSLHYRLQRIHPGLPLSAENHKWVLNRQMASGNPYKLPPTINAVANPDHFLVKPGEADKLFFRHASKGTTSFLATADYDAALLGYIRRYGVDALDVGNNVVLALKDHYPDYVVDNVKNEVATVPTARVHTPVAAVVDNDRTPLLNRVCTAMEARIISNRVQEEMFLNNCTMEEAIFKALSRVL